jgi:hypothetical protein
MKPESESKTKAAITELIEAGVADKATLVLLRATQEILRELDEIKAIVSRFGGDDPSDDTPRVRR